MQRFFKRILAGAMLLALAGQGCTRSLSPETQAAARPATLRIWAVVDDYDIYQEAVTAFCREHPNVSVD